MVIVDAYNVLMAEGTGGLDLPDLEALAGRSRYAKRGVVLVCDGTAKGGSGGLRRAAGGVGAGVRVVAAGPGRDADSLIEAMLERDSAPKRVTVVSDDRRLRRAARRVRASWMGSRAFVDRIRRDAGAKGPAPLPAFATEVPLDRGAVGHWLREFGVAPGSTPEEVAGLERAAPEQAAPAVRRKARPISEPPARTSDRKGQRDGSRREGSRRDGSGRGSPELAPGEIVDPLLLDALEEWALRPEDLDMGRWLEREEP